MINFFGQVQNDCVFTVFGWVRKVGSPARSTSPCPQYCPGYKICCFTVFGWVRKGWEVRRIGYVIDLLKKSRYYRVILKI